MVPTSNQGGHLLITVNSPGEVYYWLWPLLEELKCCSCVPRIWVFVSPCQFATGREVEIVRSFPLVERVFSPRETIWFTLGLSRFTPASWGLTLFLGGDLLYAVLLKRRTGYPLWAYGVSPRWVSQVDRYLVRFPNDMVRFPQKQRVYVGDLLASAVAKLKTEPLFPSGTPRFLFLPGSRRFAYPALFPLFQTWVKALRGRYPEASFVMGLPFHYQRAVVPEISEMVVFFGKTSSLIQEADLVITVPGSNNLEIVYREKRGIVVFPASRKIEMLPVMGPLAILEKIPYWGKILKRRILYRRLEEAGWISLPNLLWQKEILPELKGNIPVEQFLEVVEKTLRDQTKKLLPEELPSPDASLRLVNLIMEAWHGEKVR
ncbi:MAG: hypothetical protein ABDK94_03175 [Atribacterota bacterium]